MKILRSCVTCQKCFAPPCGQTMFDLPADRTTAYHPPFTFVGVDLLGPILVKVGRSNIKGTDVYSRV